MLYISRHEVKKRLKRQPLPAGSQTKGRMARINRQ